jgi:hypothetical protein
VLHRHNGDGGRLVLRLAYLKEVKTRSRNLQVSISGADQGKSQYWFTSIRPSLTNSASKTHYHQRPIREWPQKAREGFGRKRRRKDCTDHK